MTVTLPGTEAAASERDELFRVAPGSADFAFDRSTVQVFDDMVSRSVPFYDEIQRMTVEIAADFAVPGSSIYDLGCSTGTTLALLDPVIDPAVRFVGIDNSPAMLERARKKLAAVAERRTLDLIEADIHKVAEIRDASVVTLVLTLQFVRPIHRQKMIEAIADGIRPGGCMILVEKVVSADPTINRHFIEHYLEMKRRAGYSEMEIARKREALENVLIPYRAEENADLLKAAGFRASDTFFRWYNFCGLVAIR